MHSDMFNCVRQGELDEHEKLVSVLKQVDIVISTLAVPQHMDQLKIISAMKEAGNIKVINCLYPTSYFIFAN